MGLFKSLFGKSEDDPVAELSAEAIRQKIAEHTHQIEQLKRKLPSAGAMEGMEKSAAWIAEMRARINAAKSKGRVDEAIQLEAELKEASKKTSRIDKHVEEIRGQILEHEDQIELLERALAKLK